MTLKDAPQIHPDQTHTHLAHALAHDLTTLYMWESEAPSAALDPTDPLSEHDAHALRSHLRATAAQIGLFRERYRPPATITP